MRRDTRSSILAAVLLAALCIGSLIYALPERARQVEVPATEASSSAPHPRPPAYEGELHERFQQAAIMLHAGEHLYALEALERVVELAPRLPEARVNAGFALLGLARPEQAREQFGTAIELRPMQVNAYYGLAVALESLGDLDGALGAMRSYVHLADDADPYLRSARAAIWEWESRRSELAGKDERESASRAAVDGLGG